MCCVTDDHGWPDIGAQGIYDDLETPHIDALAASGVRATNGYSAAPQCVPSRAGVLTGKHQNRFGVESNGASLDGFNGELTIAERLKKAGYATGQIGKWHLGPNEEITSHGFDDVYSKNANRPCHANFTLDGKTIPMQIVDDGLYHLDACSQAALAFIRRHSPGLATENREPGTGNTAKPFFLYLAYRAPHVPLDAPKKYLDRFPGTMPERRRQALAMISAMDDGVGAITGELKKRGLVENTLVFYIGDNGAPLKIHKLDAPGGGPGWDGSLNKPMNGEKGMLAEGGIRVPFLISWPGTIPPGQVYDQPVTALDVAATALELADLPGDGSLDGVSLVPFLTGTNRGAPHEFLTWRWIAQASARAANWKYLRGGAREYLFDLESDPGEIKNVLSENPEIAERLLKKLDSWSQELSPPGLELKSMSQTWEDYYDFYLDGKPTSPPQARFRTENTPGSTQGWTARNCEAIVHDGALRITSAKGAKQKPFMVHSGFQFKLPVTARVRLRSDSGGEAGVAWRLKDQKDFPKVQVAPMRAAAASGWQTLETTIDGDAPVIHLRLLLPAGDTAVESILLLDAAGKELRSWNFPK